MSSAPRKRDRPFVPLGTLLPGRAYQAAELGAAMRAPAGSWSTLAELKAQPALRVAAVAGTMAGALAMGWRFGGLRPQLVSLGQRESALDAVAEGRVDVALVPVAQFDGWRLAHATGPALELAAWRLPMGVNLGFVTMVGREALRDVFDAVIAQALADGTLARWAADEGATFLAPQPPELSVGPSLMLMVTNAP
jgi:ABC-type amino acid transport substrate-binding protein